jgi:hypothetical protein
MLCGCFKAMSRDASAAGGLDRRFARHGRKDIDPCVRLWRLGLKCLVEPRAVVAHRFRRASIDVAVAEDAVHNLLWIAPLHFTPQKLGSPRRTRGRSRVFGAAEARLAPSEVAEHRAALEPVPPRIRITPPELTTQRLEGRLERSGDRHRHRSGRLSRQATRSPSPTR